MNTLIKHIILIFSVIVLFSACDSGRVFDQYYEIPKNGWHKDSVFNFEVPVEDSIHNHNFYIQIRNETNYPFSNVWLFVDVIYPDGEAVQDTIEVVLAEPSGKWLGKGDRKSTRLNSSHVRISYAVFCLKKKKIN